MAGLPVGSEVAGYRIEAVAGEGGMGVVYVATQLALQRRVALKVIAPDLARDPRFQERFKSESLLAASIEHPNVIPVYEAGERDGLLYLVMRYVEGTDLRALLDREGVLDPPRAARLLAQVAAALSGAHRQGLVHRDVKPANVLVVSDPDDGHEHAYLTDFGIAREMSATGGMTRTGAVVGTVDYLAPERLEGHRGDARADVYAFGCMLFESLTGDIPYPRDSDVAKMFAHANAPVPSLREARPDVPASLADVVGRCMAKDPVERYADAGAVARATTGAVGATPAEGTQQPTFQPEATVVTAPEPTVEPEPERAIEPDPEPAIEPDPQSPAPPADASREATTSALDSAAAKKRLPIGALLGILVAVVGAAVLILTLAGGDAPEGKNASGAGGATPIPGGPDGLAVVGGKVWVASAQADKLTPIDTDTGEPGTAVKVGNDPDSVTGAAGSVWVTNTEDGTVSRVDESSGKPKGAPLPVGTGPEGIASGLGSVFVANSGDGTLVDLDPSSGGVRGTAELGGKPIGVAVGAGKVWVTDVEGGRLLRVDPKDGSSKPIEVGSDPRGVAVSGGSVWVANSGDGTVSRVDEATGKVKQAIKVGGGPREIAAAGSDGVWVSLNRAGEAVRIDPEGKVAERKKVGRQPVGIAVDEASVWVSSFGDGTVTQIPR